MAQSNNTLIFLAKIISEKTGIPLDKVKTILSEFLVLTMNSVSAEKRVTLRGFGSFYAKRKKGRKYRDFRTGEIKFSKPGSTPAFQPGKVLLREMKSVSAIPVRIPGKGRTKKDKKNRYEQSPPKVIIPKKPKQPEACEVIVSTPNPRQTDNLRILFTPNDRFDSADVYPIVYSPAPDAYLKLPRNGRSNVRGYKESDFLAEIEREFTDISVSDDLHLKIPGRYAPYEPDIVLYDESINLYIDVEVDEPYDGYSRLVTHIIEGRDAVRDVFFKESGWVVVRFTEKQVHLSCAQCIRTLRNIVDSMRGQTKPNSIFIEKERRWSHRQAILWEKELYREKYLGIQFFSKQVRTRKIECRDLEEGIDLVIKRTTVPIPVITGASSPLPKCETKGLVTIIPLSQAQPPVLTFNDSSHTYASPGDYTGNTDRMSVTTLIDLFFPYFEEEAYIQKRMEETGMSEEAVRRELAEPAERGTDMHKQIENFLKGLPYDESSKEFQLFLRFHQEQIIKRGLVFDSAEYAIELKDSNIAGTVDALFRKPNGEYVMVDWKRSKHLIIDGYPKKYGFGRGLSVLSHLDNSSYYKYELQQSFYKYILEKDYGIIVSSMILAVFYPDYDRYYSIRLSEYRKQEVLDMIESYENTL
jgi:nucleoid DNA-binding protein